MTLVKKIIVLIAFVLFLTLGVLLWFVWKMNQQVSHFQNKVQEERQSQEGEVSEINSKLKKRRDNLRKEVKDVLKDVEDGFLQNRENEAKMSKEFLKGQREAFEKINSFQN